MPWEGSIAAVGAWTKGERPLAGMGKWLKGKLIREVGEESSG